MECPICGSENPAGIDSCTQCGFSPGLGRSFWPDSHETTDRVTGQATLDPGSPVDPLPLIRPAATLAEEPHPWCASATLRGLDADQPVEAGSGADLNRQVTTDTQGYLEMAYDLTDTGGKHRSSPLEPCSQPH
jgi:hypothetical protein